MIFVLEQMPYSSSFFPHYLVVAECRPNLFENVCASGKSKIIGVDGQFRDTNAVSRSCHTVNFALAKLDCFCIRQVGDLIPGSVKPDLAENSMISAVLRPHGNSSLPKILDTREDGLLAYSGFTM